MSAAEETPDRNGAANSLASVNRRRLLRAAAASGPLIATLPSGVARANASAFQCVQRAEEANQGPINPKPWVPGDGDNYLRVKASFAKFHNNKSGNDVPAYAIPRIEHTDDPYSGQWYRKNSGELLDLTQMFNGERKWDFLEDTFDQRAVLKVYTADATAETVMDEGTWPIVARPDDKGKDERKIDGAFALDGSCMCSIDPNFNEMMGG